MKLFRIFLFGCMLIQCSPSKNSTGFNAATSSKATLADPNFAFQLAGLNADECTQLSGNSACNGISYTPGGNATLQVTQTRCLEIGGT